MSIDLPPPLPPRALPLAQLSQATPAPPIALGRWRLHIAPSPLLSVAAQKRALAGQLELDEALRRLTQASYESGWLSVQLFYAIAGPEVYILLQERPLAQVQAPDFLRRYFENLSAVPGLRDVALEPHRALANVHAARAGVQAQMQLRDRDEAAVLDVSSTSSHSRADTFSAGFSNPGNRFVGRNFLDLGWQHDRREGDQLKLLWHAASAGLLGEEQRYNEETLGYSRVNPLGIWGFTVHLFDYTQSTGLDGSLREAQLSWLYPLAGTLRSRWLLDVRVDYVDRVREAAADSGRIELQERYPWAQAGLHYSRSEHWAGRPLDLDIGLNLQRGLAGTADSGARLDYWLLRPSLSLNLAWTAHWQSAVLASAQLANESLPEQSQWLLGGADNIAAYHPGIAVGDSGFYGAVDLQYAGWQPAALQITPRVFAEYGYSDARDDGGSQQLVDLGLQLRTVWRQLKLSLGSAVPVNHHGVSAPLRRAGEAPLLFSLSATF